MNNIYHLQIQTFVNDLTTDITVRGFNFNTIIVCTSLSLTIWTIFTTIQNCMTY